MAFDISGLAVIKHFGANTLWAYTSTVDTNNEVDTAGFFTGDAVNMLKVGDVIRTNTATGLGECQVLSNDGTTVDVSDVVALAATDTR